MVPLPRTARFLRFEAPDARAYVAAHAKPGQPAGAAPPVVSATGVELPAAPLSLSAYLTAAAPSADRVSRVLQESMCEAVMDELLLAITARGQAPIEEPGLPLHRAVVQTLETRFLLPHVALEVAQDLLASMHALTATNRRAALVCACLAGERDASAMVAVALVQRVVARLPAPSNLTQLERLLRGLYPTTEADDLAALILDFQALFASKTTLANVREFVFHLWTTVKEPVVRRMQRAGALGTRFALADMDQAALKFCPTFDPSLSRRLFADAAARTRLLSDIGQFRKYRQMPSHDRARSDGLISPLRAIFYPSMRSCFTTQSCRVSLMCDTQSYFFRGYSDGRVSVPHVADMLAFLHYDAWSEADCLADIKDVLVCPS